MIILLLMGCARKPIPLPPPPKPVQLTTTTTDYTKSRTHILKGWYHAHRNEWELSRQSFLLAIEADAQSPWAYIELGNAEFTYGHMDEARTAWRHARDLVLPTQVELRTLLSNKIERAESNSFIP